MSYRTTKQDIERKYERYRGKRALLETWKQFPNAPVDDPMYIKILERKVAQAEIRMRNGL